MRLAAIIPTLEEERALPRILPRLREIADRVVIADGGSSDGTLAAARASGAAVVECAAGRGTQLNAGAREAIDAGADVLVFVHADTLVPPRARDAIERALASGAVGGGFEVRFDDPRPLFALGSRVVNLRTRLSRLPLGDQAQFTAASTFRSLAGFREWPILEDLDFARRLRRRGRVAVLRPPAITSARRFVERGVARTIAINWSLWALYLLGVDPGRLARLYPQVRESGTTGAASSTAGSSPP